MILRYASLLDSFTFLKVNAIDMSYNKCFTMSPFCQFGIADNSKYFSIHYSQLHCYGNDTIHMRTSEL